MLSKCCEQAFIWPGSPSGSETLLGGIPAYVSSAEPNNTGVILYIHDIFGWKLPNARILADMLAEKSGMRVVVPDFYRGETWVLESNVDQIRAQSLPENDRFSHIKPTDNLIVTSNAFDFIKRFETEAVLAQMDAVLDAIKTTYKPTKIFSTGYCWGGRYSVLLGRGKVEAYAAAHPSLLTRKDALHVSSTGLLLIPEGDSMFPDQVREDLLEELGDKVTIVDYQGVSHGFAVRGGPESISMRDDALARTVDFFVSRLE
jgi:dienelactone hydrolase